MTSEDIGIVRTVFKWNDQERMFIAKPIDVMRLDTASISNLKALAGEGKRVFLQDACQVRKSVLV